MESIAIIGIGCRFPRANNPEAFWQLLKAGGDAVVEVPPVRWNVDEFYDPEPVTTGKMNTRWGGFLDQVDQFEAGFFGISPREAERMDPQQRLTLEVAWESLENAGIAPSSLSGSRTGFFLGCGNTDYARLLTKDPSRITAYDGTGGTLSVASCRFSYFLNLQGPSMAVETACSSSLVAIHLACQSLRSQETELCLAGGVSLMLTPEPTIAYSLARMMSPEGRCKTFDASANGYVRGEGCGIIVLKRLADALRDGDNIQAVIRSSAINQDGLSNGLTAPNGPSQQSVIRQALEQAGIAPSQISYVEAHGTGTPLGDPIEMESLQAVLQQERAPHQSCWIGSVKTNIGHLENAAGVAGLIKVVLALQHQQIPPNLHLNQLNPLISLDNTPFAIPTEVQNWQVPEGQSRLAGVSSFGFGGTNAHLILEEAAPVSPQGSQWERPWHLLCLSARDETALAELAQRYVDWLTQYPHFALPDICFTANAGRSHFDCRLTILAQASEHLRQQLATFALGQSQPGLSTRLSASRKTPKIAFLFTGQGAQYPGMGRQLYETQPTFRKTLNQCQEILSPYWEKSLLDVLYNESEGTSQLQETAYTQPALFALEYALCQLWLSWGIKPDVVMGHSVGEYVAACVAGVFSLEDGLKLTAQRGRLMQALPRDGAMAAVGASEERVTLALAAYGQQVMIAASNSPNNVVISGERNALESALQALQTDGIEVKPLNVSHAFHSPLMEPMIADFESVAQTIRYCAPKLKLISNLTGELAGVEIATPTYWCRHIRQSVQFAKGMSTLQQQGCRVFLEIGPKPTLLGMGRHCLTENASPKNGQGALLWLPSLRPSKEDWQQMLESLASLYLRGYNIDWNRFERDYPRHPLQLPTYPWQRQRYWIELPPPQKNSLLENNFYQLEWRLQARPSQGVVGKEQVSEPGSWLILAERTELSQTLTELLQQQGHKCLLVYQGATYQALGADTWQLSPSCREDFHRLWQEAVIPQILPLQGIIHLWSLESKPTAELDLDSLEEAQRLGCGSALHLLQALIKYSTASKPRLWLITRGAVPVTNSLTGLAQAPLWGLGKTIALEHPEIWGGLIDLDPATQANEVKAFLTEVMDSLGEDQLALRAQKRYVARLVPYQGTVSQPLPLQAEATYLITGGLGDLGLLVAQWMVRQGARFIALLGRRPPSPSAQQTLAQLERQGIKVLVINADLAEPEEIARGLATLDASLPPLRGIIHAAGILDDGILQQQDWQRFTQVMAPKIKGLWNLHSLRKDRSLDFLILFSSVSSLLGSPGQGNYAAANAFLDAFAHYRRHQALPGLSINWGPWSQVGMAASLTPTYRGRLAERGFTPITPEQGLQALAQGLGQPVAQLGVLQIDWSVFGEAISSGRQRLPLPILQELLAGKQQEEPTSSQAQQVPELLHKLKATPASERREVLTAHLQIEVAQLLGLGTTQLPAPQQGFFDMGMDSLMSVELKNRLESLLDSSLPSTLTFEAPSIEALVDYLMRTVSDWTSAGATNGQEDSEFNGSSKSVLAVEHLSEDEVETSIAERLVQLETLLRQ